MKKSILLAALLASTVLSVTSAQAGRWDHDDDDDEPVVVVCVDDLCGADIDLRQQLSGLQKAVNLIVNVKDATDIVQSAVNAGNLIDLVDAEPAIDLGKIVQFATVTQKAFNLIDGGKHSDFYNLEQSATNVVNSLTALDADVVEQSVSNFQGAFNTILGGNGGYDADDIADWDADDVVYTQTAVNASNLIDLKELNNEIKQNSTSTQLAINTAVFEGGYGHGSHHGNYGFDVYDFGQTATNVTNSVTIEAFDLSANCTCGYEIDQFATANQIAVNTLSTIGDVSNTVQSATNVANSISIPTP